MTFNFLKLLALTTVWILQSVCFAEIFKRTVSFCRIKAIRSFTYVTNFLETANLFGFPDTTRQGNQESDRNRRDEESSRKSSSRGLRLL